MKSDECKLLGRKRSSNRSGSMRTEVAMRRKEGRKEERKCRKYGPVRITKPKAIFTDQGEKSGLTNTSTINRTVRIVNKSYIINNVIYVEIAFRIAILFCRLVC